jgi:hypothetical protein
MEILVRMIAKLSYGVNPYRGFKSPLLRHSIYPVYLNRAYIPRALSKN